MKVRQSTRQATRAWVKAIACSGTAVTLAFATPLSSAKQNDGVAEALNSLNATVNALIATVNQLNTRVNQLVAAVPPATSVLVTPSVLYRAADRVSCVVLNTGTTPVNGTASFFGPTSSGFSSFNLAPGASSFSTASGADGPGYCRFENLSGPAGQLKGSIEVRDAALMPLLALEAR